MIDSDHAQDLATGAMAGFLATIPMTIAMELLHRRLPWTQRYPLPPREITDDLTDKKPVSRSTSTRRKSRD